MIRKFLTGLTILLVSLLLVTGAGARELVAHSQGAALPNAPDYDWWYGCSPTSAGMMMGYYDINGYGGLTYDDLVPGATAETSNYGNSSAAVNSIIASAGHIADYWTGYGNSGDDPMAAGHANNSLADFMGTSQDAFGNSDGATTFFNYTDGSRLYGSNIQALGASYYNRSGMYGMYEYVQYAGYTIALGSIYNQYTDNYHGAGFSFEDFKAEIDAGRVVMIHVTGHSMFAYGYDEDGNILFHDTWTEGEKSMAWGSYYSGMQLYGVTCFEISGGDEPGGNAVPEPSTMLLCGLGLLMGSAAARRRKNS